VNDSHLTIGDVAQRTGLTVRTLHHYDQVGLLRPTARTPAGYRLYGPAEIRRLQHIASLRRLGLSLDDITRCLDAGDPPLPEVLDLHLGRLDTDIREATAMRDRLLHIRRQIDDTSIDLDAWLGVIHETLRFERHYAPEEREKLDKQADDLGLDRLGEVQQEWVAIFDELEIHFDEGLPPTHPDVLKLARRAQDLIAEFTGGDPGITRSLQAMYEAEGSRPLTDRGMHTRPDVWGFLGAAMEARRELEEELHRDDRV
jgi:DNA-binding transcriptional MerR regulator